MRLKLKSLLFLLCLSSCPMQSEIKINLGIVSVDWSDIKANPITTTTIVAIIASVGYGFQDYWLTPIKEYMKKKEPVVTVEKDSKKDDPSFAKHLQCSARIYQAGDILTRFKDIAGCYGPKMDFYDLIEFLKDPIKFKEIGAKIPKGVLMHGPAGTGKTSLAKAVAGEANCAFLNISGSEFVEAFVGVGAARVRDLFAKAKQLAPCIIFIDEFDAVGKKRSANPGGGNDEHAHTLAQLLTLMDGFDVVKNPIIVIAATNRMDVLDPAVLRPGRFDRKVEVGLPFVKDRVEILKVHLKTVKCSNFIDLQLIARATVGFSGADLANLVNEAAILAVNRKSQIVEMSDIDKAYDHVTIGRETLGMDRDKAELMKTAIHESGHVMGIIYQSLLTDPLYKVSITPRGGALGITWSVPLKENYGQSKDEFKAKIIMLLAGGLAEEAFEYGEWTGKSNDLMRAYRIAYSMVAKYGMSDALRYISYEDFQQYQLPNDIASQVHYEVQKIVDECYENCKNLIDEHKSEIEQLAHLLMKKGTVSGDEVYKMFGLPVPNIDFRLS